MKFFISFILLRLGLSGALIWYTGTDWWQEKEEERFQEIQVNPFLK